ncbi:uncharacterized protein FOMMEDRAFT_168105 [Fomitiporia mediterranea MF3/22]|uniref:uncharacterized protein n=1 Tax=Fomitiporia mediterranea (strain MF3/22) TaxID=694068 RepID=UPI0004407ED5|nr:uncharacterized protein FOMMEDRAFT_168105 [Fomitiporia mediterranea MF3/22]EJD03017.1 hypothetical protein FOMMEDRAFT_168105 [Fomitiporia mediterranea MF3/22]
MASSPSGASIDTTEAQTLPTLTTFLRDVPPQLVVLLAELGPHIAAIRRVAEAASWKSEHADSWILLGLWWAVCLLSEFTLRYFLIIAVGTIYVYLSLRPPTKSRPPVTEQNLQATVIDLSVIEALLPTLPRPYPLQLNVLARLVALAYLPSLALTYFVRLKFLLGVFGTIVFIWRAHWAAHVREAVWRSAWFRRGLARVWSLLSGQPSQPVVLSTSSLLRTLDTSHSVRFLITVYENQRWWVGLDWTAALLPSERPPWCSASLEPIQPPSVFALPPPTCSFVGDGKGGLVKRTATWNWDEGEWKVSVKKDLGLKRVEKELPALKEDTTQHANRVGKAKQKIYETGQKLKTHRDSDSKDVDEVAEDDTDPTEAESTLQEADPDEQITDNDGWVYGDNKWKAFSGSGGLGKYTRFRKWTRVALLTEVVEPASAVEAHTFAAEQQEAYSTALRERQASVSSRRSLSDSRRSIDEQRDGEDDRDSNGLRQRLKAALRKSSMTV